VKFVTSTPYVRGVSVNQHEAEENGASPVMIEEKRYLDASNRQITLLEH